MKPRLCAALSLALLTLLATPYAHALYRCGNVYQDKPCANPESEVRLAPTGRSATGAPAAATGTAFAQVCARMGQEAQKVAWKREAGATQEKQLAELPPGGSREEMTQVIASVYSRRGSAPEIKTAVEAECHAEKQREADKAAALAALQPKGAKPVPADIQGGASAQEGGPKQAVTTRAPAADPRSACRNLRSMDASLREQMRAGGSASTMEMLNGQRRMLDQRLSDARC